MLGRFDAGIAENLIGCRRGRQSGMRAARVLLASG
jgi:hypothetical protein